MSNDIEKRLMSIAPKPSRSLIDQWRLSCANDIERNLFDGYCRDFLRLKEEGRIQFGIPTLLHAIGEDERIAFIDIKPSTLQAYLKCLKAGRTTHK